MYRYCESFVDNDGYAINLFTGGSDESKFVSQSETPVDPQDVQDGVIRSAAVADLRNRLNLSDEKDRIKDWPIAPVLYEGR